MFKKSPVTYIFPAIMALVMLIIMVVSVDIKPIGAVNPVETATPVVKGSGFSLPIVSSIVNAMDKQSTNPD